MDEHDGGGATSAVDDADAPTADAPSLPAPDESSDQTPLGAYVAALAFGLLVLVVPTLNASFWMPRTALLLTAGGLGLPRLVALLRSPLRAPALAAVAFAVAATLSTAVSAEPHLSVFGHYNLGTGLLYVWCLAGLWALGATVPDGNRRHVRLAVLAGVALNLVVATVGTVVDLSAARLAAPGSRSVGLLGNSVHLSALGAGAVVWAAWHLSHRRWWWTLLAAGGAYAVQVSGGRSGLLAVAGVLVVLAARRRWAVVLVVVACVVVAAAVGTVRAASSTATGTGRLARDVRALSGDGGARGYTSRVDVWMTARDDLARRPLVGVGPGQFREASTPDRTEREVHHNGPDHYFGDAHNVFVEYLATTGVLGFASFAAFGFLAVRHARGDLRWLVLGIFPTYLLQPQNNSTFPLLFLLAGIAAPHVAVRRRWLPAATVLVAAPAFVLAGVYVYGDSLLATARLDGEPEVAERAARLTPWWSYSATVAANTYNFYARGGGDETVVPVTNGWREEAIRRDPNNPRLHTNYGHDLFADRRLAAADARFGRALELDPNSVSARIGAAKVAGARRDWDRAIELLEEAQALEERAFTGALLDEARRRRASGSD